MTSYFCRGAITLALLSSIGAAQAQLAPERPASSQQGLHQPATEPMALTQQQRSSIFRMVITQRDKVKTPPPAGMYVAIGAEVPASLELYTLPDQILSEVPATKQYKYTLWHDQVVLVDPINMKVVEIIRQ